jgi:transposase
MRLRNTLVDNSPQAIHHMQKALFEMNVQLSNVLSDIVGQSGLQIIEAILAGQRDPEQLAALCSSRIKASRQTVANSLHGNVRSCGEARAKSTIELPTHCALALRA